MSQVDQPSSRPTNQSETCVRPSASATASATPPVRTEPPALRTSPSLDGAK